jgi:antirestriction protein ArdC
MIKVTEGGEMELPAKDNSKVTAMLTSMGRSVEELRSSDAWKAMLKVQARFHKYSASNQLMIYMQNPEATQVAGFRQWQGMGRQVQKGEKSIKIFAPMTRKDTENPDKTVLTGFKLVSVFDVTQTQGEPLPLIPWPEAGHCPEGLYDNLVQHAESLDLTVLVPNDGEGPTGARGWYTPVNRTINVRLSTEAGMSATLLHEMGHALDPLLEADDSRARKELVAESCAFVLGMRYGVQLEDEVTHYLASWGGGVDELLSIVDRVKQAVMAFERSPLLSVT